ncbi:MAG: AMP-binding protein [Flavobacteriaceae bacterium]|nr:AMP-binding protein [Flavobacteriaceae bacterium]
MTKFNSPLEAFLHWEKTSPNKNFLSQPLKDRVVKYTYKQAGTEIRRIASAIQKYNLPKQSHIALLSLNCAHWVMSDIAIMMTGHVSIPIYPTLNAETVNTLLSHSESKLIIIGKVANYKDIKPEIKNIPKISIKLYGINDGESWEDLVNTNEPLQEFSMPKKDDLITIIYTSGTTGTPKGVMHTVGNFAESSTTLLNVVDIPIHSRSFSYLPLAHISERIGAMNSLFLGSSISFFYSLETFASDLENTQPHIFFAVPRIWCKFQGKILTSIPQEKLTRLLKIPIINTILKNKLKKKLGLKKAVYILSGAAPLEKSMILWFETIGITIHQVYGMTEDSVISHFNLVGKNKPGTVGKALPGVKIRLSDEGEICIKNNCLMKGYFKAPDITAKVFDKEGYLLTGDIGEYDKEGYLTITGRVKDQFKTDKGKYISPAPIELEISKNENIEQICIVGTGIPQPIALITLSKIGKKKAREFLISSLELTVLKINKELEKHEKIEKVVIIKLDWTVENGFLTPTLKLKRNTIEKDLKPYYKNWFSCHEKIVDELVQFNT